MDIPSFFALSFSPFKLHSLIQLSGDPTASIDESGENSTEDTLAFSDKTDHKEAKLTPRRCRRP